MAGLLAPDVTAAMLGDKNRSLNEDMIVAVVIAI